MIVTFSLKFCFQNEAEPRNLHLLATFLSLYKIIAFILRVRHLHLIARIFRPWELEHAAFLLEKYDL